jgi:hypothetical protein
LHESLPKKLPVTIGPAFENSDCVLSRATGYAKRHNALLFQASQFVLKSMDFVCTLLRFMS